MYYTPFTRVEPPPWNTGRRVPSVAKVSTGRVFYSYAKLSAVEEYDTICIPILRPDNYFGCKQWEVNETVYLVVQHRLVHPLYGRCCVFRHAWHVFRPWALRAMRYSHRAPLNGELADWYELKWQDVAPFTWGFYVDRVVKYALLF